MLLAFRSARPRPLALRPQEPAAALAAWLARSAEPSASSSLHAGLPLSAPSSAGDAHFPRHPSSPHPPGPQSSPWASGASPCILLPQHRGSPLVRSLSSSAPSLSSAAAASAGAPAAGPPKIVPPFTEESARAKVQFAEDAWNSRDPERVALAYTPDSHWRNRTEFFSGRQAIKDFLYRKWEKEQGYRLMKELWCYQGNRIAVRFEYEWHDDEGQWHRTHGNELWEFDDQGLMQRRDMSANDYKIQESERRIKVVKPL